MRWRSTRALDTGWGRWNAPNYPASDFTDRPGSAGLRHLDRHGACWWRCCAGPWWLWGSPGPSPRCCGFEVRGARLPRTVVGASWSMATSP